MRAAFSAAILTIPAVAIGATVTLIQPSAIPAGAPVVTFDGLPASANLNLPSYSESGVTLSGPIHHAAPLTSGVPNDIWLAAYTGGILFSEPVVAVGWTEYSGSNRKIALFADEAGTQPMGIYNVAVSTTAPTRFHGFLSDTPFRRMAFSDVVPTHGVNDLRYIVAPEPGTLLGVCAAALVWPAVQRRRR
jgi:hypothetical protein